MALTHKEMTAHIRKRFKVAKVPARVRMFDACGVRYIQVITPKYDARWNEAQLDAIGNIAANNGLTGARKSPIDVANIRQLTATTQINFEFHGEAA